MVEGIAADPPGSPWLLSLSSKVVVSLSVRSAMARSLAEMQRRWSAANRRRSAYSRRVEGVVAPVCKREVNRIRVLVACTIGLAISFSLMRHDCLKQSISGEPVVWQHSECAVSTRHG